MRRKWIIAVLVLMLTGGSGWAWAEEKYESISVFFTKINVLLNDMPLSQQREMMMYDGQVYVPLSSLSDMLGAEMRWSEDGQTISIDFMEDDRDLVYSAAQRGLYQYVAIEKRSITADMSKILESRKYDSLKNVMSRIDKLHDVVLNMPDAELAKPLEKMRAATEWLRSSYLKKNTKNAKLAWVLFGQNLDQFNNVLKERLATKGSEAQSDASKSTTSSGKSSLNIVQ